MFLSLTSSTSLFPVRTSRFPTWRETSLTTRPTNLTSDLRRLASDPPPLPEKGCFCRIVLQLTHFNHSRKMFTFACLGLLFLPACVTSAASIRGTRDGRGAKGENLDDLSLLSEERHAPAHGGASRYLLTRERRLIAHEGVMRTLIIRVTDGDGETERSERSLQNLNNPRLTHLVKQASSPSQTRGGSPTRGSARTATTCLGTPTAW